ncbi:hypothetical protein GGR08_001548 [Bartonella fuyuanensis]|uniref:Uncharacterized protein n=1 Tax=Bartonella fuyuanensis TaxID=1460968 RepID=A0A840DWA5_9HYPH|nr:hypothetical protein [Bartonella fuyuanensis]
MSLLALIISCYAAYTVFKTTRMFRQEIDEKDEMIREQEKLIQKLSFSHVSYCVNCSKIVCREVV